jgi:hypothetical protein
MLHRCLNSLCVACALSIACSSISRAEDDAAAGVLFDRGLSEMQAGRFDKACPLLAESHRLDPQLACYSPLPSARPRAVRWLLL